MTKRIKSTPIGQTCHRCGGQISATLFEVDGELLVCETCKCKSQDYPDRLATFTLDAYNEELKNRIKNAERLLKLNVKYSK